MAMRFPQYVGTTNRTTTVVGLIDYEPLFKVLDDAVDEVENDETLTDKELENLENEKENLKRRKVEYIDGKGYVDENEQIWIFCSEGKPKNHNSYPYFWLDEDGKKVFSDPPELVKKAYCVDRMVDLSVRRIVEATEPGEQLYNEKEINDMNAAAAFFVPTFREDDDFLKKIVKTTILEKGIDINRLKNKTEEKYQLPNMKSALENMTKMSVIYFYSWMDLLGCDFEITIIDRGDDKTDPLKYPLVFQSYSGKVGKLIDGDIQEIPPSKFIKSKDDEE